MSVAVSSGHGSCVAPARRRGTGSTTLTKLGDWVTKWTPELFGIEMTGAWLETEADGDVVGRVTVTDRLDSVMGDIEDPRDVEYLESDGSN